MFGEDYWRSKRLRDNVNGIRLEKPDEELASAYQNAVGDVEVFTDREFYEEPDLWKVPDNSARNMFEDGIYFSDVNSVVVDHTKNGGKPPSEVEWDALRRVGEHLENQDVKDVLLEEAAHGIQDQHNGVTNYEHGPREYFRRRIGLDKADRQPDFATEGFADYVVSYLGDQSIDLTADMFRVAVALRANEEQKGFFQKMMSSSPEVGAMSLDHAAERYAGHLFYKSIEKEEGLDEVINTALDSPPEQEDLTQIMKRVEDSGVDKDEEVYEVVKKHLLNKELR